MFAPEPPRTLAAIAVEAVTVDGRLVDPYNQVASRFDMLPQPDGKTGLPTRLGQNQMFSAYSARITWDRFRHYREGLRTWIYRHHERTGNPDDRILHFRVYRLLARTPEAATDVKGRIRRDLLFDGS
jgi:hypothetical protein